MYHAVDTRPGEHDPDNLFVPVASFAAQLDALEARGLTPVSLTTWLSGTAPRRSVLLTFDDAYVSTLANAAPLLVERGWPAVVYVASRTVGGTSTWNHCSDEPLLSLDGVRELVDAGFEVGAHSRTHVDLRGLPADELEAEVQGSVDDLADALGAQPTTFAYPFGTHDEAARAAVTRTGVRAAFSVHEGSGRYAVTRVDVNGVDTARSFALKLHPLWPVARGALSRTPAVRRALHSVVGKAQR